MLLANTFETGVANGTTLTNANSSGGSAGDAFNLGTGVTIDSGATLQFDANAAYGSQSVKLVNDASPGVTRFGWTVSALTTMYGRCYFYRTANPVGTGHEIIEFQSVGVAVRGLIDINTTGNVRVLDQLSNANAMSTAITLNSWHRLEFRITCATSGTGTMRAELYAGHSTSLIDSCQRTDLTMGATTIDTILFGQMYLSDANGVCYFDAVQINDSGFPGPVFSGLTKAGFGAIG